MASFSASFYNITETTAHFSASFTGGDSSFIYARYVSLTVGDRSWTISNEVDGGSDSSFFEFVTGLSPSTTYFWSAKLGYWDGYANSIIYTDYTDSGIFTTEKEEEIINVPLWSWISSNGTASASQTRTAYEILNGQIPANDFNHNVWNDLVNKVSEVHLAITGAMWDTANGSYLTKTDCLVSSGDTLSAEIYNAIKYNVGSLKSTGIQDVYSENKLTGYHIIHLTDVLNEIINGE